MDKSLILSYQYMPLKKDYLTKLAVIVAKLTHFFVYVFQINYYIAKYSVFTKISTFYVVCAQRFILIDTKSYLAFSCSHTLFHLNITLKNRTTSLQKQAFTITAY